MNHLSILFTITCILSTPWALSFSPVIIRRGCWKLLQPNQRTCYTVRNIIRSSRASQQLPLVGYHKKQNDNRYNHFTTIGHDNQLNWIQMTSSSDNSEANDLLQTAARLRKEAEELEQSMQNGRQRATSGIDKNNRTSAANQQKQQPPRQQGNGDLELWQEPVLGTKKYTSVKDSTWVISYRFASDAVNRDTRDQEDNDVKPIYYTGKVIVTFTADGYTVMVTNNDKDGNNQSAPPVVPAVPTNNQQVRFQKFWGWDEETSRDDGMQYVLFSADVLLPASDPNAGGKNGLKRFYFQCRVNRDEKTDKITMSDGTVTLKKDIEPPGGFWGVFNAGGILAQFRYCGNFLMKAVSE